MLLKKIIFYIFIIFGISLIFTPKIIFAETLLKGTDLEKKCNCVREKGVPLIDGCQQYCGEYGVNDFVLLAKQASDIILGLSGSLALLAFIYGGVMFLISSGNNEQVSKAKSILMGAVIGLVIVFISFTIVSFVFKGLGIENAWHNSDWFFKKNPN